MGMLRTLLGPRQATWTPAVGTTGMIIGGNSTNVMSQAGERVTEGTALTIPSVFSCVRVIGEDIAKIPTTLHRPTETEYGPGFEPATDHAAYPMLTYRPNAEMTAFNAKQALAISAALWGNGYARIMRRGDQTPAEYIPLLPWRTKVERTPGGRLQYVYNPGKDQPKQTIRSEDMIHITGPTVDGLVGWMIAGLGAQAIGIGLAAAKFTGSFFSNGASLKGIVTIPEKMGTDEFREFSARFKEEYEGAENQNKTAIFDSGATYNKIGSTPKDAQMIDTLRYSLEDIARLFRCHPQKLYDRSRAQGWSTLEILNLEHLTDSLMPWFCRIEQEMARKLLTDEEIQDGYKIEHQYDYLLAADLDSRADYFESGIQNGYFSVNEVRAMINRNPIEGGNTYLQPLNMADAATRSSDAGGGGEPDDQDQGQDYRPQVIESFTRAMQRVIDRERNAASRKASDHAALVRWAADWYPGQRQAIIAELSVPARLLAALEGTPLVAAEQAVERYADKHIADSLKLIAETPADQARDELDRWQTERAGWAARHLCDEVHHEAAA